MAEELVTSRLLLRQRRDEDLPQIAAKIGDWDVARMLASVPYPYRPDMAQEWFQRTRSPEAGLHLAIAPKEDPSLVFGIMSLHVKESQNDLLTLGYWLGRAHWGQGYATEAARRIVDHGFETHADIPAVRAWHFGDNPASANVLRKVGLKRTGNAPLWHAMRARHVDHIEMVLTRIDWEASREVS